MSKVSELLPCVREEIGADAVSEVITASKEKSSYSHKTEPRAVKRMLGWQIKLLLNLFKRDYMFIW